MTRARPKFTPTPRVLSDHETAVLMGKGDTKFRELRPSLEAAGFPKYDDLLGGTDSEAVHRWLDRRSGLSTADADQELEAWQP